MSTSGVKMETGSLTFFWFIHTLIDDRFVVKQMVSSWNIAEKDELLKFAPKYFEYMEQTNEAPTVLAKIFGFYTFKIKNGTSGQIMKIDVLVMEHLFYNQKITRVKLTLSLGIICGMWLYCL